MFSSERGSVPQEEAELQDLQQQREEYSRQPEEIRVHYQTNFYYHLQHLWQPSVQLS